MIPHELSLKRCVEAGIDHEKYVQSHRILCSLAGENWLSEQEAGHQRTASFSTRHPLYRDLTSPTEQSIALVCELADYLLAFKYDPKLKGVVENLRSRAYSSTLLELATAYRWKEAGCTVRLRPPVPGGEGDVGAEFNGTELLLEASTVAADMFVDDPRFRLIEVAQITCRRELAGKGLAAVEIAVGRYPGGNVQEKLRHDVSQACRRFSAEGATQAVRNNCWTISVRALDPLQEENPLCMKKGNLDEHGWRKGWDAIVSDGTSPAGVWEPNEEDVSESVRLFFRFPPKEGDPTQLILEKLKKERRQLRGVYGIQAVILDVSAVGTALFRAMRQHLTNEVVREISRRRDPAAVWLLYRGFSRANRFGYGGAYIANPAATRKIPAALVQRLQAVERRLCLRIG